MASPHVWKPCLSVPGWGCWLGVVAWGAGKKHSAHAQGAAACPGCLSLTAQLPPFLPSCQDNFGYDLPAVEAAMKKHEAIEADISSYQERIQVVVELAQEMESEGYYDSKRISAQKDKVLRQWGLLTELVRARRARLEQNVALQKIFQEMVYMIDWMDEMQVGGLGRRGRGNWSQHAHKALPRFIKARLGCAWKNPQVASPCSHWSAPPLSSGLLSRF